MSEQTISVTRALSEIKHIGDRINRAITNGRFIAVSIGEGNSKKVMGSGQTVTDIDGFIKSSFDSVKDLIERRKRLKSAIILSNSTTKVTIGGKEMSVAEAIELKSSIAFEKAFLHVLKSQYSEANSLHENARRELEKKIEAQLSNLTSGDKNKLNEDSTKAVTDSIKNQFQPGLIDPISLREKIEKIEEQISTFEQEVDFALSESNAKTTISV